MAEIIPTHIADAGSAQAAAEAARQLAMRESMIEVFSELFINDGQSPILVKSKIPRLCDAVDKLTTEMKIVKTNMRWMMMIGGAIGTTMLALLGFILEHSLKAIH